MQFNHINPLHWTPFVQQCHDDILTSAESQNDIYLAYYSNLQRISEDVKHSCIHCFPQQPQTWNGAVAANFKLLLSELERFKASLPESLSHNGNLHLIIHSQQSLLPMLTTFGRYANFELSRRRDVSLRNLLLYATYDSQICVRSPKGWRFIYVPNSYSSLSSALLLYQFQRVCQLLSSGQLSGVFCNDDHL